MICASCGCVPVRRQSNRLACSLRAASAPCPQTALHVAHTLPVPRGTLTSDAAAEGKTATPELVRNNASVVNGAVLQHQQPGGGVGSAQGSAIFKQRPIGQPALARSSSDYSSWPADELTAATTPIPPEELEPRRAAALQAVSKFLGPEMCTQVRGKRGSLPIAWRQRLWCLSDYRR